MFFLILIQGIMALAIWMFLFIASYLLKFIKIPWRNKWLDGEKQEHSYPETEIH